MSHTTVAATVAMILEAHWPGKAMHLEKTTVCTGGRSLVCMVLGMTEFYALPCRLNEFFPAL